MERTEDVVESKDYRVKRLIFLSSYPVGPLCEKTGRFGIFLIILNFIRTLTKGGVGVIE